MSANLTFDEVMDQLESMECAAPDDLGGSFEELLALVDSMELEPAPMPAHYRGPYLVTWERSARLTPAQMNRVCRMWNIDEDLSRTDKRKAIVDSPHNFADLKLDADPVSQMDAFFEAIGASRL